MIYAHLYEHDDFGGNQAYCTLFAGSPIKSYTMFPAPWFHSKGIHDRVSSVKTARVRTNRVATCTCLSTRSSGGDSLGSTVRLAKNGKSAT